MLSIQQTITIIFSLICAGVIAINMYLSYMGTHYQHLVTDTKEEIRDMRDELIYTVSHGVLPSLGEKEASVSHLVIVNQTMVSLSQQ